MGFYAESREKMVRTSLYRSRLGHGAQLLLRYVYGSYLLV